MTMVADDKPNRFDWSAAKGRLRRAAESLENAGQLSAEDSTRLLESRAAALSRGEETTEVGDDAMEVICFQLAEQTVAIETDCVKELRPIESITSIPDAPEHFVGITNLSGTITAIIDIASLLSISGNTHSANKALVLGWEEIEFGIAVDQVQNVRILKSTDLISPPPGIHSELIRGITAEGIIVLASEQLIESDSLYINETD